MGSFGRGLRAAARAGWGLPAVALLMAAAAGPDPDAAGDGLADRFTSGTLADAGTHRVTSLQFGPDGRLYVGQQNGLVRVLTVERRGAADYAVTDTETIGSLLSIPNHDDTGARERRQATRLLTGILVAGTAERPVVYAATSDPRIGGGPKAKDPHIDTNSGVLSRLTFTGARWERLDLVRGLPRSRENHHANGLALDPDGRRLYIAQGGMTNAGAPSTHFVHAPEYALSAAILAVDLEAIGDDTYDLPTLDDAARPGALDDNDPFGGAGGDNQARLVAGGPVTVFAPGFRNPYDVVVTADGRMYTVDNGANPGWGDVPEDEGPEGRCTNALRDGGGTVLDVLHHVDGPGYYGGHPNPTRANPRIGFNPDGQSPVAVHNPVECDARHDDDAGGLALFGHSTNGLVEYRAANLDGALAGNLLAVSLDRTVYRVELVDGAGYARTSVLFDEVSPAPLDVTAQGDGDAFPGTIWVGDVGTGAVTVFEPDDYAGAGDRA